MRRLSIAVLCSLSFFVSACSLNGSRMLPPSSGTADGPTGDAAVTKVTVKITVATKSPALATHSRAPHYFSASSAGLLVQAYAHGKKKVLAKAAVDITPGSKACAKKKTTPRTCSATLMLAPSKGDDFTIADYDAKPAGRKIPTSAHLLGYGKLTNKKVSRKASKNDFRVFLGGVVTALSGNAGFVSLPGDGAPHELAIVIDPSDFGNQPITAGTKDPFANPITVSLSETGGSGHALLSLNGGAGATSVVVRHSTDAVSLDYDGGGSIGYGATVALQASAVKTFGGANETIKVSPLLLGGSNADYAPGLLSLKGNGDMLAMNVGELGAPSGTKYSVVPSSCDAIASATTLVQSSATSASFIVFARPVSSTSGCVLAVSDGTSTANVGVKNVYLGILGASPNPQEFPIPTSLSYPAGITLGADGEMWFTECGGDKIGKIPATGVSPTATDFALPFTHGTPTPYNVAVGPDGKMWWADGGSSTIGATTTNDASVQYPTESATTRPYDIVAGPDGDMWFPELSANAIDVMNASGQILHSYTGLTSTSPYFITVGSDGNLWFTECGPPAKIGRITTGGTIAEFPLPSSSAQPQDITAGPDGAIWFTEVGGSKIGRIPTNATPGSSAQVTEYPTLTGSARPLGITVGPDGALWFTENAKGRVGRLDPVVAKNGASTGMTEYLVPAGTGASPNLIASGPDGALWFTECASSANNVARLAIQTSSALKGRSSRSLPARRSSQSSAAISSFRSRTGPSRF